MRFPWKFDRWAVACGCPVHGDHLGCEAYCWNHGCTHPLHKSITRWGFEKVSKRA